VAMEYCLANTFVLHDPWGPPAPYPKSLADGCFRLRTVPADGLGRSSVPYAPVTRSVPRLEHPARIERRLHRGERARKAVGPLVVVHGR